MWQNSTKSIMFKSSVDIVVYKIIDNNATNREGF